ncbi:MAG: LacI family DNA-binding transcriptional regulator, partial [Atopobium sp.]|nr:LacI family DNA-binding transcriptional regulator [Atopobium sp.]
MTRVSIRDVAAETGYSPATVSNVLNEKGNVGAKATHIILEAIARLGYSRSAQISRIIFAIARVNGHIVDESAFQAGVYTGIERAARRLGLPSAMVTLDLPDPVTSRKNIAELE